MTILLVDNREPPDPHPWARHWPDTVAIHRGTLETGDITLAGNEGVVVERKTAADFLACLGRERPRFEKELLRARYLDAFVVIVEGSLPDVLATRGGLHPAAIIGSVAAWTRRGWPILFAGDQATAASLALKFLCQPIAEAQRLLAGQERETELIT